MSDIVFNTINENFPVAGQDNDTQVFRDNFNSIKTALSTANTEITDLQDNVARKDQENDFNYNLINRAVIQGSWERKRDYGPIAGPSQDVSLLQGHYHVIQLTGNCSLVLQEFPTNPVSVTNQGVGKITLELTGDGTKRTLSITLSGSTVIKKNNFPALTLPGSHLLEVESDTDPVIIEIWQHNADVIFLNYVGQFS